MREDQKFKFHYFNFEKVLMKIGNIKIYLGVRTIIIISVVVCLQLLW